MQRLLHRELHVNRGYHGLSAKAKGASPPSMSLYTRLTCTFSSCLIQSRRAFSTSIRRPDFHFDTHHFVQRLEREGLNRAQAEGIMSAMAEVIDESIRNMTSNMVTKAEQEKVRVFILLSIVVHPILFAYSIIIPNKLTSPKSNPNFS